MASTWILGIALGFYPLMQQPWLSCAGCRAAIGPKCMARLPKAFRGGGQNELWEGAIWEGRVAEITDFGCFIQLTKQGVVKDRGLLHVSELASERIEGEAVRGLVESTVGPVGSKVRVRVMSLEFKGKRAVSLKLLDVLSRDSAEEISARALAPGPRHRLLIEEDEM